MSKVLVVDDVTQSLNSLKEELRTQFQVEVAMGGNTALKKIKKEGPYAVLVVNYNMTAMDGVQFLERAQELECLSSMILMVAPEDIPKAVEAVKNAPVFKFIQKPYELTRLTTAVKSGIRRYEVAAKKHQIVEQTILGTVQAFTEIMRLVDPLGYSTIPEQKRLCAACATRLDLPANPQLLLAASLSLVGAVIVPQNILIQLRSRPELSGGARKLLHSIAGCSSDILGTIPRFEGAARILKYVNNNFDGSSEPADDLAGYDIPIESRILRVVASYLGKTYSGVSQSTALLQLAHDAGSAYDSKVVKILSAIVTEESSGKEEEPVKTFYSKKISELLPGDILAEEFKAGSWELYLPKGSCVTANTLELIRLTPGVNTEQNTVKVLGKSSDR